MKNSVAETITGAAVIVIAAAFFFFVYNTSNMGGGSSGKTITAAFQNASGISVGSDIRMAGIKIGSVTGQSLDKENYQAVITMALSNDLDIPEDTTAKITAEGLLGAKFIALEPGGSEIKLADGGQLTYTQSALDIWSLVSQYMFNNKNK